MLYYSVYLEHDPTACFDRFSFCDAEAMLAIVVLTSAFLSFLGHHEIACPGLTGVLKNQIIQTTTKDSKIKRKHRKKPLMVLKIV
jgi:hypothetical protein